MNGMRRSRFLVANAAAAAAWSAGWAFGAFALGGAATRLGSTITVFGLGVAGVLLVVLAVVMKRSMRRLEQRAEAAYPDPSGIDQAPARLDALTEPPRTADLVLSGRRTT